MENQQVALLFDCGMMNPSDVITEVRQRMAGYPVEIHDYPEPPETMPLPERATFARALESLINSYSIENGSNTPDFILASLLMQTLKTWELHTVERDRWWGNRSLLGVGGGGDVSGRTIDGAVPTSEKTLLPGVDTTQPRDLVAKALGRVPGPDNYQFSAPDLPAPPVHTRINTACSSDGSVPPQCAACLEKLSRLPTFAFTAPGQPTDPPSRGPGRIGHQGAGGEPGWKPPFEKHLGIPTGLTGAVNNLYCFHEKFGAPWITDEPTWPGQSRMKLRRDLVDEECFVELSNALIRLEYFVAANFGPGEGLITRYSLQYCTDKAALEPEFRCLMANVADGIVDSIYVLIGMGGEMGLDLSEVWRRVHVANMAKEGGRKRADGKILKPEGWVAPDVEGAIFKMNP